MTPRPSQVERVLALLRSQGARGVNTAMLQEMPVLDGGAPILRLAARVRQLKDAGYVISSQRQSNGTARYTLVSEPERATTDDTQRPSPAGRLGPNRTRINPSPTGAVTARGASELSSPAEAHSLFDTSSFTERGGYRDTERAA